jgi:hypothetical protein
MPFESTMQFLDSLHLDFSTEPLIFDVPDPVTPTLGHGSLVTGSAKSHFPSSTASSPSNDPTASPLSKSSTAQWYRRFHLHRNYTIDAGTLELVSQRAPAMLASLADPSDSTPVIYAKYVAFMISFKSCDVVSDVVSLVMHLFFFIADGPDACLWAAQSRAAATATQSTRKRAAGRTLVLYEALQEHLPPGTSCDKFAADVKHWRKVGSSYAFLARRLGLGALVHARVCCLVYSLLSQFEILTLSQNLLHPHSMWGCAQGNDHYGASERTLHYLESEHEIGLPKMAQECGSEALMHRLMWMAFGRFNEFEGEVEGASFPGFERT